MIESAHTCAIEGHEHESEADAGACIDWLRENWAELHATGLPIKMKFRFEMAIEEVVTEIGRILANYKE